MRTWKRLSLGLALMSLLGCAPEQQSQPNSAAPAAEVKTYEWKLVTTWPKNFPGLGVAPENFAKKVEAMSAGRLKVKVYGAGDLVPAFEVFDTVSQGTAEMGHSAAYYWKGKVPAAQVFTTIPFGMNAQQMNGWLNQGGGLELWQELYQPFGLIPMPGGNSGVQMGGWFNKEINSLADLEGLKMRLPGLGGEVLSRLGGVPVTLPGGELFTALQTGAIDATEWVGPYNDLAFGLHKAAKFYYYPGWHEPGTALEFMINEQAFKSLPADLQEIVVTAAQAVNQAMLDEYTTRNIEALRSLTEDHGIELKPWPPEVLAALRAASTEVMAEQAAKDPAMKKVLEAYQTYANGVRNYHRISENAYDQMINQ
ncbi:TRAP transporter substrate-binding protein [Ferrimonas lipolytica]|uniref:TRAP transporter substrate-binding protein DctP n=1 Tax=Ferrimonas lipolytica TaxID=2724191 RepID=A0A6H1UAD6_9GAMM|nr:TRAP transporter substrate-binding protein DctP [Ferrimonas lipolytica]QIZ75599.1 TRAP transporter substrate-binding protein DctP [Ferrimonas lipolytica]